jgi:rhodanese-related sulfurtransferase
MSNEISREELQELVQANQVVVFEVLPPKYYAEGHLPGARNLPLDRFEQVLAELALDRSAPIVTYCTGPTCANSGVAAARLGQLGYANVRVFKGGKEAWRAAGLALSLPSQQPRAREARSLG